MQGGGHQIQNAALAIGGHPARLFDQHGNGVRLVDQPQPPLRVAGARIAGVQIDPAADQDAIAIGHQGGDPAHVIILLARAIGTLQAVIDIHPGRLVPVAVIGRVDGEFAGLARDGTLRLDLHKGVLPR